MVTARPAAKRFRATETTTHRDLARSMSQLGASSLRVTPRNLLDSEDIAAGITFERKGQTYSVQCSKWGRYLDNLRACERIIYYLYRASDELGVSTSGQGGDAFDRVFGGLKALPGASDWASTLGVERSATSQQIQDAYRRLAKIHAPDAGGDAEEFKRITAAYNYGMGEAKRRAAAVA